MSDGGKPRTGGSTSGSRRCSGAMTGEPGRRSPNCWGSRPARSASGSASSATRGWRNSAPCTTGAIPVASRPAQVERLKQEIATGVFHNAEQVRTWIEETFGVAYSVSGVKDLLRRIGASYHKVSGFFWKADVEEQKRVRAEVPAAQA